MHSVTRTTGQTGSHVIAGSMFGSAYVSEGHVAERRCYLGPSERRGRVANFAAILKMLRSALSLR